MSEIPQTVKKSSFSQAVAIFAMIIILFIVAVLIIHTQNRKAVASDEAVAQALIEATPDLSEEEIAKTVDFVADNPTQVVSEGSYDDLLQTMQNKN